MSKRNKAAAAATIVSSGEWVRKPKMADDTTAAIVIRSRPVQLTIFDYAEALGIKLLPDTSQ